MRLPLWISFLGAGVLSACAAQAQTPSFPIYDDALRNGFDDWSWSKTHDLKNAELTHGGTTAIRVVAGGWEGLQLHHERFDTSSYSQLSFWVNGGAQGGQKLRVVASRSDKILTDSGVVLDPLPANTWQKIVVPLDKLGVAGKQDVTAFILQNNTPDTLPAFFVDDVVLGGGPSATSGPEPTPSVAIEVDARADRHPISPLIYGASWADASHAPLRLTLNRWGGNSVTRYNWQQNVDNKGNDWFFESIPNESVTPGGSADNFVQTSENLNAAPMITIPMIPFIAKVGPNRSKLASFSVAKYGAQQKTDQWMPDAGNGVKPDGTNVTGNDPNDANTPNSPALQTEWIKHLIGKWGPAKNGGVRYYLLDNEPGLWHSTHRDVVAKAPTAFELRDTIIAYAKAIRAADPDAKIVGFEEWGWTGFLYSPADVQNGPKLGWKADEFADRKLMGGMDFQPWLLKEIRAEEKRSHVKLLDIYTLHIYPQAQGIGLSDTDDSVKTRELRSRSTRAMWDPNYTDESWINAKIGLIPRMKQWVADNAPGLPIGITEYNWGGDNTMSGALAQAELLGLFGREGLDVATRWAAPTAKTPVFTAFQMFRSYDGKNAGFGDTSIRTLAPDPDATSAFGAIRSSDGALTLLVVQKDSQHGANLKLSVKNFLGKNTAQHWQFSGNGDIKRLPDVPVKNGALVTDVPPQSLDLFVVPKR